MVITTTIKTNVNNAVARSQSIKQAAVQMVTTTIINKKKQHAHKKARGFPVLLFVGF
jgi:hypothetical protein